MYQEPEMGIKSKLGAKDMRTRDTWSAADSRLISRNNRSIHMCDLWSSMNLLCYPQVSALQKYQYSCILESTMC